MSPNCNDCQKHAEQHEASDWLITVCSWRWKRHGGGGLDQAQAKSLTATIVNLTIVCSRGS